MNYLLDTCILSESIKKIPNKNVLHWLDQIPENQLYLSVITLGELFKGIQKLPRSAKRTRLAHWVEEDLKDRFLGKILPLDLKVMQTWGTLVGELENQGRLLPTLDSLIAATAATHKMTVVTRNVQDMIPSGIPTLNPWNPL